MADSAFDVGSRWPIRVDAANDHPIELLNRGDTLYCGQTTAVSASSNDDTVTTGQKITLSVPTWVISASQSHVLLSYPVASFAQAPITTINQVINEITQITQQIDPAVLTGIQGQFETANARFSSDEASLAQSRSAFDALYATLDDTQLPRCHLYRATNLTCAYNDSNVYVDWSNAEVDHGGFWSVGAPTHVTIPETGPYMGIFKASFAAGAGGVRELQVTLNDATVPFQTIEDPMVDGTTQKIMHLHFDSDYVAGDYLRCKVFQNQTSTGTMTVNGRTGNGRYSLELLMQKGKMVGPSGGFSGGGGGGGTFSALSAPAINAWYDQSSLFYKTIATLGVTVRSNSAAMVTAMLSTGAAGTVTIDAHSGQGRTATDYTHAVYKADSGDASHTIHQTDWQNVDIEGVSIKIPAGALPSGGTDFTMAVIQPDNYVYQLWNVTSIATGTITCGYGKRTLLTGDGLPTNTVPYRGGTSEAGYGAGLGILRADEWVANSIDHALVFALDGYQSKVYPATTVGRQSVGTNVNSPPMGVLLRLDPTYATNTFITTSGFPTWKQRVLTAIRDYGMYAIDNGGSTCVIKAESETPYVALSRTPTVQQYLDTTFSHTPNTAWDMATGVDWTHLQAMSVPAH